MRIKFIGPLNRVTGSGYHLTDPATGHNLLVDFGMVQGEVDAEALNRGPLPFDPKALKQVILTHAHIDHCGLLPRLYKEGYSGSVYTLNETAELAKLVLRDAAKHDKTLYTQKDVDRIQWHEPGKAMFGNPCPIGPDLFVRFFRSGHILGAASVTVMWGSRGSQRTITFSGDLGPNPDGRELLPLLAHGHTPVSSDYVVMESTYGGTTRPVVTAEERLDALDRALSAALFDRGGVVIIPAFAIGKTQDVLTDLHLLFALNSEKFGAIPVYLDAPLASRVGEVYAKAADRSFVCGRGEKVRPAWLGRALGQRLGIDLSTDAASLADCVKEMLLPDHVAMPERPGLGSSWRRIWTPMPRDARSTLAGPAIVVTGGGMCEGGPVLEHFEHHLDDPRATVMLVGYAGPSTLGGALQELTRLPASERARDNRRLCVGLDRSVEVARRDVRATVELIHGYSGHRDQPGLLDWLFETKDGRPVAPTVFLTHGDGEARRSLDEAILSRAEAEGHDHMRVECPTPHHGWFDLDRGEWAADNTDHESTLRAEVADLRRENERLKRLLSRAA
jgi:metallo-beta-lactamase family protein